MDVYSSNHRGIESTRTSVNRELDRDAELSGTQPPFHSPPNPQLLMNRPKLLQLENTSSLVDVTQPKVLQPKTRQEREKTMEILRASNSEMEAILEP